MKKQIFSTLVLSIGILLPFSLHSQEQQRKKVGNIKQVNKNNVESICFFIRQVFIYTTNVGYILFRC
jgi:hypothetical protein